MTTNPLHKPARLDEEPELTQEEAIPSDGKDEEGEQQTEGQRAGEGGAVHVFVGKTLRSLQARY